MREEKHRGMVDGIRFYHHGVPDAVHFPRKWRPPKEELKEELKVKCGRPAWIKGRQEARSVKQVAGRCGRSRGIP
jgi:hypothetical protein